MKTPIQIVVFIFYSLFVNAQKTDKTWTIEEITIQYNEPFNTTLSQSNIVAFTCGYDGKPMQLGRCVFIENLSEDTIYYRNANIGSYQSIKNSTDWTWSPSNMLTFLPIPPNQSEILCFQGYEDATSKGKYCKMIAEFKFVSSNKSAKNKIHEPKNENELKSDGQVYVSNTPVNQFYVFFTTKIEIPPLQSQFSALQSSKSLYIISTPILHSGNVTDILSEEQTRFILDAKKQLANHPKNVKESAEKITVEQIEVHYGQPYSTDLLITKKQGEDAIEAYKQSTKELLEGLTVFDFVELHE